jgi:hypothetical protein
MKTKTKMTTKSNLWNCVTEKGVKYQYLGDIYTPIFVQGKLVKQPIEVGDRYPMHDADRWKKVRAELDKLVERDKIAKKKINIELLYIEAFKKVTGNTPEQRMAWAS